MKTIYTWTVDIEGKAFSISSRNLHSVLTTALRKFTKNYGSKVRVGRPIRIVIIDKIPYKAKY